MNKPAKVVKLKTPIEFGSEYITEVALRKVKTKDLRQVSAIEDEFEAGLQLLGNLSGLTPAQVDEIDADDLGQLIEVVADFLPKRQETGKTS